MGFIPEMQEFFNILKSISVIPHKSNSNKSHIIISIEAEKTYDKIQHLLKKKKKQAKKKTPEVGIEGAYLNIIKAIYDKAIASIILSGEKLKTFPLRSRTRQGCPLLPL